ncbi:MAG: lipopolysaccharide assembly protein LapB [Wenzhouxiangella sp.]
MTEIALLFLLLPLAALSGWLAAQGQKQRRSRRGSVLSRQYFRGLNYLLNEESDKAIEEFLKLAEVNRDTVDTHLALGTLFRRRGEMDKAIRYHKHIISRPNLDEDQRERVLFELAMDYMRAGLLDRAESLFLELTDSDQMATRAHRHLLDIYQQEKDWARAVEQAQRLELVDGGSDTGLIAQLYCELADGALADGDPEAATQNLRQARRYQPGNARARLIEARIALGDGELELAAEAYRAACELDPDLLVTCSEQIIDCHRRIGQLQQLKAWLADASRRADLNAPVLLLARLTAESDPKQAAERLLQALQHRSTVRGLEYLMELLGSHDLGLDEVGPELIRDLMQRLMQGQPVYRCQQCGFSGSAHHWMCPSCRSWNSTRVIRGVLGE